MLKKRIAKWDLDRKHKELDMLYALRIAFQRESEGKMTVFFIRGRMVTFEDIKHYFRRKGVRDLQFLTREADTADPTTRIECRTPVPFAATPNSGKTHDAESLGDVPDTTPHQNFNLSNFDAKTAVVALPDPNQVGHAIHLSTTLDQLDQLLHLGHNYYACVFDDPQWRAKDSKFELESLEMFYHHVFDGQSLLERDCVAEAFEYFNSAFDLIDTLLKQQAFLFLPYLYHMMLPDRMISRQEVLSELLRFVSQMARTRNSQLAPIQHSVEILQKMSINDRDQTSQRVFRSLLDYIRIPFELESTEMLKWQVDLCSLARQNTDLEQNLDNYKLISIAVLRLADDADLLENFPTSRQEYGGYRPVHAEKSTSDGSVGWYGWHADIKCDNILITGKDFRLGDFGVLGYTWDSGPGHASPKAQMAERMQREDVVDHIAHFKQMHQHSHQHASEALSTSSLARLDAELCSDPLRNHFRRRLRDPQSRGLRQDRQFLLRNQSKLQMFGRSHFSKRGIPHLIKDV
jgi:hypothetical protein